MRLPEQRLWDRLSHLMTGVWTATRIENRVEKSSPDVFFAHPDLHGWIELKVYNPPLRPDTRWRLSNWTAGQQDWARRYTAAGVPVWVVVHFSGTDRVYVLDAREALEAQGRVTLEEFRRRYEHLVFSWKYADGQLILALLREVW